MTELNKMIELNKMTEEQICEYWKNNDIFSKSLELNKSKKEYVFKDGPPFMSGKMHYGHILSGMIKDSVVRYFHNNGFKIDRYNGSDCHGLPIEYEIEKELGIKTTQQVEEFGIRNYNEACRGIVLRYADDWEEQMGRLGRWVDFKNQYKTMDLSFMNSVWWVFKNLYDKGRIYEGVKIMGYSTTCGTPLSNFEIQQNYQEVQDDSLFIKLPLVNNNQSINLTDSYILVWTTTPWTLPSNYALCVGSTIDYVQVELEGTKYICGEKLIGNIFGKKVPTILNKFKGSELVGLEYIPPFDFVRNFVNLSNSTVHTHKIIGGNFVTDSDGTGIVHLAPSYGADDYQVCLDNGLVTKETKLFQPLDANGFVSEIIPELKGVFYKNYKDKSLQDLNTWVVLELKKKGYYMDKRSFKHNYPFCWRSDTPLIYRTVNSWFVKVEDMRERLGELNSQINWVPKSVGEARFASWLGNARDWGVSRNRFWGTPIPIWKSDSGDIICIGSSYELERLAGLEPGSITDLHRHNIDHIEIVKDGKVYRREKTVLDCWFESGAMPYATVGRIGIVELLEKHCKLPDSGLKFDSEGNPYIQTDRIIHDDNQIQPLREKLSILPADFIAEGLDQTRGWFYTLLVLSTSLFDMIPFKNVIVNGLILAEDGKKMSKRLKNYPDPMEIVKEYGSDALRLYLLNSQATRAEPLKFSKAGVHNIVKDIIIPLSNTIVFWKEYMELYVNTHKSNPIIPIKNNIEKISNPINLWVLRKYHELRDEYITSMEQYNLKNAVGVLYKLVEIMNNGYIKMGRQLIKGKESQEDWIQSLSVLSYVIGFILNDFKSVIPFFCESQYQSLKNFFVDRLGISNCFDESIHLVESQDYVILGSDQISKSIDFDIIYNIITQIYQLRSTNDISLKKPVRQVNLIWDSELETRYLNRFKEYLTMVLEECNLLDIKILSKSDVNIKKTITPVKALFFKNYGKEISTVYDELCKINSDELEKVISEGEYKGFSISSTYFNYNHEIDLLDSQSDSKDLVYKEFNFGEFKDKIIILMDKSWTEANDKIYYYRLVATSIQRSRKNAGLHPWDEINALWEGEPKYSLNSNEAQEYIGNITRIKLLSYQDNYSDSNEHQLDIENKVSNLIYSSEYDNIGIKLHLAK
jgi:isoleucyl-tRNA synthetase